MPVGPRGRWRIERSERGLSMTHTHLHSLSPLLTLRQVAEFLGVDERTLFSIRRRGELPTVHIGSSVRVTPQALRKYIADREKREGGVDDAL